MRRARSTGTGVEDSDTMRPEYDFSGAVRGVTAARYADASAGSQRWPRLGRDTPSAGQGEAGLGASIMLSATLDELLKLAPDQRAELALALWESLSDVDRDAELALSREQEAELDRRLAEHLAEPASAIPWEEVRRKLTTSS
jgi:putative addiction module component (TIGR02574 family)